MPYRSLAAVAIFVPALFATDSHAAPNGWTCEPAFYADGTCDCGCGAVDSDCPDGTFVVCQRSGCRPGQVPWEHTPQSCMDSACGDGWLDALGGEACDDGEALAAGGCGAGCKAVNAGWACETEAKGCHQAPADDAPDVTEAVADDAPEPTEATPEATPEAVESAPESAEAADADHDHGGDDGCAGGVGSLAALGLLVAARSSARRGRSPRGSSPTK